MAGITVRCTDVGRLYPKAAHVRMSGAHSCRSANVAMLEGGGTADEALFRDSSSAGAMAGVGSDESSIASADATCATD